MKTIKISELPLYTSLKGLYTIGTDIDNRSVKVSLEFVEQQTSAAEKNAEAAKAAATKANNAADEAEAARQKAETATKDAQSATANATAATTKANDAATKADTATKNAEAATSKANTAAEDAKKIADEAAVNAVNAADNASKAAVSATEAIEKMAHTYARKDGAYEGLLAGSALNLQGQTDTANSSMYRTSGGSADIATGLAEVTAVRGESIAWNQLVKNGNFADKSSWAISMGNFNVEGNVLTIPERGTIYQELEGIVRDHKYLLWAECKGLVNVSSHIIMYLLGAASTGKVTQDNTWTTVKKICTTGEEGINRIYIYSLQDGETSSFRNIQLFDLTLIYGKGKEPETVEQFEADYQRWFGKSLSYDQHDPGSIRNVKATDIRTVGFNLSPITEFEGPMKDWTSEFAFENKMGYTGRFYIQADIEASIVDQSQSYFIFRYTDGTKNYAALTGNGKLTAYSTAGKIIESINGVRHHDDEVKITNICINFSWSGKRDGEYEPHWEQTHPMPLTALKGRLNGQGKAVIVFPDGLKRAGDVYDEIKVEAGSVKAIKRVGVVDLGSLDWANSGIDDLYDSMYKTIIYDFKTVERAANLANILASRKYKIDTQSNFQSIDYAIMGGYNNAGQILLKDTSFVRNPTALKASLQGIILYYELAEPEEYIIDDEDFLPLPYKVDDFGTEQIVSPEGSIAPTLMTRYGVNAVDTLRRLPDLYLGKEEAAATYATLDKAKKLLFNVLWNAATGASGTSNSDPEMYSHNGLTDITFEEAVDIFVNGRTDYPYPTRIGAGCRTNILTRSPARAFTVGLASVALTGIASYASKLEVLQLNSESAEPLLVSDMGLAFYGAVKLKKVIGAIDVRNISSFAKSVFAGATLLEELYLSSLKCSLPLHESRNLNLKSFQWMIEKATNTSAITITVHADIYNKLTSSAYPEWQKVFSDAAARQISFVSA